MPKTVRRVLGFELCAGMGTTELASDCLESSVPFTKCGLGSSFRAIGLLPGRFRGALPSLRALRENLESKGPDERRPRIVTLKVISWNLLRLTGAGVEDVAAVIEQHRPDLLLLQEATEQLSALPARVGGCFFREPLNGRIYGLAVWSPHPLAPPYALPLPVSRVPGRVPPRVAQIVQLGEVTFANVHLSHGQFLNRRQLLHIANVLDGPAAVVGDYNAIGPIKLAGFEDIGPRQPTHSPNNTISLRLDRCMARGLRCSYAKVLARGRSDHHPIRLDLHVLPAVRGSDGTGTGHVRRLKLRDSVERWARAMSDAPNRIRVRQTFFETLDVKFRKAKRGVVQQQRPAPVGVLRQLSKEEAKAP